VTPDNHRQGVIQTVDYATGLCTVTVGGTTLSAQVIGEMPVVGATVWVEQRGDNRSDWVVLGTQAISGRAGIPMARYAWGRVANGIAASAFIDVGTPPTTPWSTGSIAGGTNSRITISKDCYLGMHLVFSGQFSLTWGFLGGVSAGIAVNGSTVFATSQAGGVYYGAADYAGIMANGEVIEFSTRNATAGLQNLVSRGFLTFADATILVAQT
jgi:hypothetical protein